MKRILISLFCMVASICACHAQKKIVGDMNDDGKLNMADVTVLINTLLGKTAEREISGGFDETSLVGSWMAKDGTSIIISSGGKASMSTATVSSYDYNPTKGSLVFYNSSNSLVTAYQVVYTTSTDLVLREPGNSTLKKYYPANSYATSISIYEATANISVGQTKEMGVVSYPAGSNLFNITWYSSNTSVAVVSETGIVTARSVGTAKITGKSIDGKTVTCTVTVRNPVTSLTLPYSSLTLPFNSSFTIDAVIKPSDATNKTLTWTSSNTSVATVSDGKITVGSTSGTTTITATTTDGTNLSASCTVKGIIATPTGLTLSKTSATLAAQATLKLSATIVPTTAKSLSVVWSSSDESIATVDQTGNVTAKAKAGTAIIRAKIAGKSITKSCTVTVDISNMYVDLGLSSGTLWAKYNLGANSPAVTGDYYAWGETEPKQSFNWSNYKWCEGTSTSLTKYNTNKKYGAWSSMVFELSDDAAYTNWGSDWKIPSSTQFKELINNCTWTWTAQDGVNGYKVVGPNGNSIFIPACGEITYYGRIRYNEVGIYWSSDFEDELCDHSVCLFIDSGSKCMSDFERYEGITIRPVRNK